MKDDKVERLAEELAEMTGESKSAAILRALEERKERVAVGPFGTRRLAQVLDYLEREVWPEIPDGLLGRGMSREEREQILG